MTPCVEVNGATIRMLIAKSEMRQKDVSDALGVSEGTLSRWCRNGRHPIEVFNAKRLASLLKCDYDIIIDKMPSHTRIVSKDVAEDDLLTAYRGLTPLHQARIRVAIDEMLSNSKHGA